MNKFDMVIENYLKLIISEAGVPAAPGMPAPPPPADPAQIGKDMDKSTLGIIAGDQTVKSLFNNIKKFKLYKSQNRTTKQIRQINRKNRRTKISL